MNDRVSKVNPVRYQCLCDVSYFPYSHVTMSEMRFYILKLLGFAVVASRVQVPSEMVISEKWDTCLERTVINFGVGFVAGGLGSLVLAREYSATFVSIGLTVVKLVLR